LWIPSFQLLSINNRLVTNFTKMAQNNVDSFTTPKKPCVPQVSQIDVVQKQADPHIEEVRVNMAEMKVEDRPVVLVTNVGSCIAICIHDQKNKCGGLAHIMLPTSRISNNDASPLKYADTAVPALTEALRKRGKRMCSLSAKIAGGANMFPNMRASTLNIGKNNVDAVKEALEVEGIKLVAEDVRGNHGRRVIFNVIDGTVYVRSGKGEVKKI
jgi:chemotaxis protein CheD